MFGDVHGLGVSPAADIPALIDAPPKRRSTVLDERETPESSVSREVGWIPERKTIVSFKAVARHRFSNPKGLPHQKFPVQIP